MIYWIGYVFWKMLGFIFYPISVSGFQNLPQNTSYILASNHLSNMDPMLIGLACRRRISYLAKEELFKNKLFAWLLYHVGAFPVKRDSADIGAIKEALKRLKSGCPLVIFPEGTRQPVAEGNEVQAGISLIAVKSGVPVVPVFIRDSDKVMPKGARFLKRYMVKIIFGEPEQYTKKDSYPQIALKIMGKINSLATKVK